MIKRVYIEITNLCNLRCSFCSFHHRDSKWLSLQDFENILKQVKPVTDYIYLHVQGEPLLHPQFNEILSLCDQYQMNVQLVTNGSLIHKYESELISHPCIRKISVSLQSIPFQQINIVLFMEQLSTFIERCSAQKHPFVEIRFWREDEMNHPSLQYCYDYLKQHYDFTLTKKKNSYSILPNIYVDFDNTFNWPDINDEEKSTTGTCHGAIHQIAILSNGNVIPCCLDYDGNIAFGNIFETSLQHILHSERYLRMVYGLQRHYLEESYCRKCTFRQRFSK